MINEYFRCESLFVGDKNPSQTGTSRTPFRPLPQAETTVLSGFNRLGAFEC